MANPCADISHAGDFDDQKASPTKIPQIDDNLSEPPADLRSDVSTVHHQPVKDKHFQSVLNRDPRGGY